MANKDLAVCQYCGKEVDNKGLKNHERFCPENPANVKNDTSPELEISTVTEGKPAKKEVLVPIAVRVDLRTYIGDRYYDFKAGKEYQVSQNVKDVLKRAGMLSAI